MSLKHKAFNKHLFVHLNFTVICNFLRGIIHFSKYTKFFAYVCKSRGKKCQIFGKFGVHTK